MGERSMFPVSEQAPSLRRADGSAVRVLVVDDESTLSDLLSMALRTLPVGSAYAVWTGIGAAGTAILGMALLGDSTAPLRVLCIVLILAGVIGLKLVSAN